MMICDNTMCDNVMRYGMRHKTRAFCFSLIKRYWLFSPSCHQYYYVLRCNRDNIDHRVNWLTCWQFPPNARSLRCLTFYMTFDLWPLTSVAGVQPGWARSREGAESDRQGQRQGLAVAGRHVRLRGERARRQWQPTHVRQVGKLRFFSYRFLHHALNNVDILRSVDLLICMTQSMTLLVLAKWIVVAH